MILGTDYLKTLLKDALAQVATPEDYGVVLEGSIAEGFGNDSSDIDFLVVVSSSESFPGTPTVLFLDGRKVDVRLRSTREVQADTDELLALLREGTPVGADLLNRCQRLRHAVLLSGEEVVEPIRSVLSTEDLQVAVVVHFEHQCRRATRLAVAMLALGRASVAANWARTAVGHAAKFWAAKRGETYLEGRWIFQQLDRVEGGTDIAAAYRAVRPRGQSPEQLTAYVTEAMSFMYECGVDGLDPDPNNVVLDRAPAVTSWQIGSKVHVLRGKADVFALNDDACSIWRKLVFGTPLPAILARAEAASAGPLIAEFHALGLVGLRWQDGPKIDIPATSLAPSSNRPLLSVAGAVFADTDAPVKLLPISARQFAAAGMALSWGNVLVESVRQDAVGAIAGEQWGVFEIVARRMMNHACLAILSAHGVDPLPPPEQACEHLRSLPGLSDTVIDMVDGLEGVLATDNRPHAEDLLQRLDQFTALMRDITGTGQFPVSFGGTEAWRETLKGFFDWVRVGAYLDARFPREDLRELLQPIRPLQYQ
jgi:hypothetical protein